MRDAMKPTARGMLIAAFALIAILMLVDRVSASSPVDVVRLAHIQAAEPGFGDKPVKAVFRRKVTITTATKTIQAWIETVSASFGKVCSWRVNNINATTNVCIGDSSSIDCTSTTGTPIGRATGAIREEDGQEGYGSAELNYMEGVGGSVDVYISAVGC